MIFEAGGCRWQKLHEWGVQWLVPEWPQGSLPVYHTSGWQSCRIFKHLCGHHRNCKLKHLCLPWLSLRKGLMWIEVFWLNDSSLYQPQALKSCVLTTEVATQEFCFLDKKSKRQMKYGKNMCFQALCSQHVQKYRGQSYNLANAIRKNTTCYQTCSAVMEVALSLNTWGGCVRTSTHTTVIIIA